MLLITLLILIFAFMALRAFHWNQTSLAGFAVDTCKLFCGALLTMITQRAISKRGTDETVSTSITTTTPKEGV